MFAPASRLRGSLSFLASLVAMTGCPQAEVNGYGEFGRPIDLVADGSALPRLLMQSQLDSCDVQAGPCSSLCVDTEPGNCPADACVAALVDSASPFTVLPSDGYALGRECLGVRQGHEGTSDAASLASTVTRFEFSPVPTLRAPSTKAGPWEWDAGSAPGLPDEEVRRLDVGAVLGGNLLKHFAVRLTDDGARSTVTFYEQFPGTQKRLEDLGFAYLRLQYPNRLLGTRVNDRCAFGEGVACELEQQQIQLGREDLNFEETRMVLDACVAPPPCAPLWEFDDLEGNRTTCELRPGKVRLPTDVGRRCVDADDREGGGKGASLIVGTGVDGLVLFEDSARRMFGDLDALPSCDSDDGLGPGDRACKVSEPAELHMTGYERVEGLTRLRVRSLALLSGYDTPSAPGPCTRLRRRLAAAQLQCRGLDELERPYAPNDGTEIRRSDNAAVLGETVWTAFQDRPLSSRWLLATVLPADDTITMNLRREAGTDAVQPDGVVGSAMLRGTDVVLDYTESDAQIGVRLACSDRDDPTCASYPRCSPTDARQGENSPGRASCCWGMPNNLVEDVIRRDGSDAQTCCGVLNRESLERLQMEGLCVGVELPSGIGGITP